MQYIQVLLKNMKMKKLTGNEGKEENLWAV